MKTETGVELEENDATKIITRHAEVHGISARCFLATFPNGYREYVLVEGGNPVFASQLFEQVAAHIDMWALADGKN